MSITVADLLGTNHTPATAPTVQRADVTSVNNHFDTSNTEALTRIATDRLENGGMRLYASLLLEDRDLITRNRAGAHKLAAQLYKANSVTVGRNAADIAHDVCTIAQRVSLLAARWDNRAYLFNPNELAAAFAETRRTRSGAASASGVVYCCNFDDTNPDVFAGLGTLEPFVAAGTFPFSVIGVTRADNPLIGIVNTHGDNALIVSADNTNAGSVIDALHAGGANTLRSRGHMLQRGLGTYTQLLDWLDDHNGEPSSYVATVIRYASVHSSSAQLMVDRPNGPYDDAALLHLLNTAPAAFNNMYRRATPKRKRTLCTALADSRSGIRTETWEHLTADVTFDMAVRTGSQRLFERLAHNGAAPTAPYTPSRRVQQWVTELAGWDNSVLLNWVRPMVAASAVATLAETLTNLNDTADHIRKRSDQVRADIDTYITETCGEGLERRNQILAAARENTEHTLSYVADTFDS